MRPIMSAISLVDLLVRSASCRTSSATTAKPRPWSPARAADGGIEGEQVGLLGDLADGVDDRGDLLRVL